MSDCLIVAANAVQLAEEVARLSDSAITVIACSTVAQALVEFTDESIVFGEPTLIAEVLPAMSSVNWVQSSWAGVTPLMLLARRDYVLTGIKGVFGPQISEYVFAYLLAHELKVVQRFREQREHRWFPVSSGALRGKRLGIIGTGTIGKHIANTGRTFDLTVVGLSRSGAPASGFESVQPIGQIVDFLDGLDFLVIVLPETAATDNLLDSAALARLPAHAYLINVGRGNVIDDDALIDALTTNRLAGAALDVFDEEPLSRDSALWDTSNLSITAHIAARSYPALVVPIFMENYRRYRGEQALKYVIDFETGY